MTEQDTGANEKYSPGDRRVEDAFRQGNGVRGKGDNEYDVDRDEEEKELTESRPLQSQESLDKRMLQNSHLLHAGNRPDERRNHGHLKFASRCQYFEVEVHLLQRLKINQDSSRGRNQPTRRTYIYGFVRRTNSRVQNLSYEGDGPRDVLEYRVDHCYSGLSLGSQISSEIN